MILQNNTKKMLLMIYDVMYDEEVIKALSQCPVAGFSKWNKLLGKGQKSDPKMDDAVWPGYNCAVIIEIDTSNENIIYDTLQSLYKFMGNKGLKVYGWPIEQII